MPIKLISIAEIDLDGSPHTRYKLRTDVISEYAELYKEKKPCLPEVDLFKPENSPFYLVADGLHRIAAAQEAGLKSVVAIVTKGSWADCMRKAAGCNVAHGLRRSAEDKHCLLEEIFRNGGDKMTDMTIAMMAYVGVDLVRKTRRLLEGHGTIQPAPVRANANGQESSVRGEAVARKDWTGYTVPEPLWGLWSRRKEAMSLINTIEQLRKRLFIAEQEEDSLYAELDFHAAAESITNLKRNLKLCVPFAVCTQCQGQTKAVKECSLCKGRGMISEFRYKTVVPEEVKALRKKTIKQNK